MENNNKFKAIVTGKCPQCQKGSVFQDKWWHLKTLTKMNKLCPVCNVNFEVEPGFFFGAMYMSYGISLAIMLFGGVFIYNVFNDPSVFYYIVPITIISLIFTPFNFRISRIIYLNSMSGITYKNSDLDK